MRLNLSNSCEQKINLNVLSNEELVQEFVLFPKKGEANDLPNWINVVETIVGIII